MKGRPRIGADAVRSTCKLCPRPVLTGQDAAFIDNPAGLSHTACIEAHRKKPAAAAVGGDR